jgi:septal ring factor EnvC (AmiA/AmiB activator)
MNRTGITVIVMAAVSFFFSCSSTTGFMGLAKEQAVIEMDEQKSREIEALQIKMERLDSLSEELEEALAKAEQAGNDAAQAVELARNSEEESADTRKKMEEMRSTLKKLDRKIKYLPRETIDELISILNEYLEESGADNEYSDDSEDADDGKIDDAGTDKTESEIVTEQILE